LPESLTRPYALKDEGATQALAAAIADALPDNCRGWCILLQGELGSGKSTVARALLRRLGHKGPVPSPTYTLVEPYELPDKLIYHIDLYRITGEDEVPFLGWSDWQDGLMLVEWPERAGRLLDSADLSIRLDYAGPGRHAMLAAVSDRGAELIGRLAAAYDPA
jgi:tRNA threonylcarbamoyladenosine biosynthesis protein TsaE